MQKRGDPRSFNPEKKTGRDVSDRISLDCTGLERKIRSETLLKIQSESRATIVTVEREI